MEIYLGLEVPLFMRVEIQFVVSFGQSRHVQIIQSIKLSRGVQFIRLHQVYDDLEPLRSLLPVTNRNQLSVRLFGRNLPDDSVYRLWRIRGTLQIIQKSTSIRKCKENWSQVLFISRRHSEWLVWNVVRFCRSCFNNQGIWTLEEFALDNRSQNPLGSGLVADADHFTVGLSHTTLELDKFLSSRRTRSTHSSKGELERFAPLYITSEVAVSDVCVHNWRMECDFQRQVHPWCDIPFRWNYAEVRLEFGHVPIEAKDNHENHFI